jgi:hypothetical protein
MRLQLRWLVMAAAAGTALAWAAKPALVWADIRWAQESVRDVWGRIAYDEDWQSLPPLPKELDYRWLDAASRPLLIAHALGEAATPTQNSLAALHRALSSGLRLLEVDVWLDEAGVLRCHHGPDRPQPWAPGGCTLAEALHAAAKHQAWLVLDIKTDFALTGEAVVRAFAKDPAAARLVFQLYRPADVALFSRWAAIAQLPGPIVTAYRARRSLVHIAGATQRLGIRAITVPLYRLPALQRAVGRLTLLVHPVHDCAAAAEARALGANGYYLRTELLPGLRSGCAGAAVPGLSS